MSPIFDLTAVFILAAGVGVLFRLFNQPLILAYIFAGLIIGFFNFLNPQDKEIFQIFSQLGVMFLLFLIGLEINYRSLRLVGKTSLIVGVAQIIFTFAIGFLIAVSFDFNYLQSAYIAIALTFSSTIIVVKLLSEKKDLQSLYGKISVGFLLVQDFVAIILLLFLTGAQKGEPLTVTGTVKALLLGAALLSLMLYLGRKILPLLFDKVAKWPELLFLTATAWCLGVVYVVSRAGFPLEIGGFMAGIALANSSEYFEISSKIKVLRDFFVLIFFVILGSTLVFAPPLNHILPLIVFSLFVLIGNPLIILIIMGLMGYPKRVSLFCGLSAAQISEFSLILMALGLRLGHVADSDVSLIVGVGIITMAASAYFIMWNEEIFRRVKNLLTIFERRRTKDEKVEEQIYDKPIVLVGCHRTGQSLIPYLKKDELVVVDFDPEIISLLKRQGYTVFLGDIADEDVWGKVNIATSRLIISTSPDFEDNLRILHQVSLLKSKPKVILRAENERDAEFLYKQGADYVILPHFTSGQYLGRSIVVDKELKILEQLKNKDLEMIRKLASTP